MALLFAGNEITCFERSGTNVAESTFAGSFDSSKVRCSLAFINGLLWARTPAFTASTTVWVHAEVLPLTPTQFNAWLFTLVDSGGNDVIRMGGIGLTNQFRIEFWSGSAWVLIGNTYPITFDHRVTLDIMVKCGVAGEVAVYLDSGALVVHGTADLSAVSNFQQLRVSSLGAYPMSTTLTYVSQIIVADEPTIQWSAFSLHGTGAGTGADWNGLYSDVNEIVLDDSTFIYTTTANQVDSFPVNSITVPAGYFVKGLVLSMRARISTAGPQNAQFLVRSAGTNYTSSSVSGIFYNYQPFQTIFTQDPATSANWTQSGINAVEIGVKSIA